MNAQHRTAIGALILVMSAISCIQSLKAEEGSAKTTPNQVQELIDFITKKTPGKKPQSRHDDSGKELGVASTTVTIVTEGLQITLQYFPPAEHRPEAGVSLFWRKQGTVSDDERWHSSVNPDGATEEGGDPKRERICFCPKDSSPSSWIGPEHLPFWQQQVHLKVVQSLAYFRQK